MTVEEPEAVGFFGGRLVIGRDYNVRVVMIKVGIKIQWRYTQFSDKPNMCLFVIMVADSNGDIFM